MSRAPRSLVGALAALVPILVGAPCDAPNPRLAVRIVPQEPGPGVALRALIEEVPNDVATFTYAWSVLDEDGDPTPQPGLEVATLPADRTWPGSRWRACVAAFRESGFRIEVRCDDVCVTGPGCREGAPSPAAIDVALVASASASDLEAVRRALVADGLAVPLVHDLGAGLPDPLALADVEVVVTWTDADPPDPVAAGDALAEAVEGGRGLVALAWAMHASEPVGLAGALVDDGWLPWSQGEADHTPDRALVVDVADHPIVQRLDDLASGWGGSRHVGLTLLESAELVAHWDDGVPAIAWHRPARRPVVGLGFAPLPGGTRGGSWEGDGAALLADAIRFAGGEPDPPLPELHAPRVTVLGEPGARVVPELLVTLEVVVVDADDAPRDLTVFVTDGAGEQRGLATTPEDDGSALVRYVVTERGPITYEVVAVDPDGNTGVAPLPLAVNRLPTITSLRFEPESPGPDDDVSVVVTTDDPDGDPVRVDIAWRRDGLVEVATGSTMPASVTGPGDRLACAITLWDGLEQPPPHVEPLTIGGGAAPTIVVTQPASGARVPSVGGALTVAVSGEDPPTIATLDVTRGPSGVGHAVYRRGDAATEIALDPLQPGPATLTVTLGDLLGPLATTSHTLVVNTPPGPPSVDVAGPIVAGQALTLAVGPATDADGDPLTASVRWALAETDATLATTATLPAGEVVAGRAVRWYTTLSDGLEVGPTATGVVVVPELRDDPPVITIVSAPDARLPAGGVFDLVVDVADDHDGPDALDVRLVIDGLTSDDAPARDGARFTFAAVVVGAGPHALRVEAEDAAGGIGAAALGAHVNRPPAMPGAGLATTAAGDALVVVSATSDPDGDPITLTFTWHDEADPDLALATDALLPAERIAPGGRYVWRVSAADAWDVSPVATGVHAPAAAVPALDRCFTFEPDTFNGPSQVRDLAGGTTMSIASLNCLGAGVLGNGCAVGHTNAVGSVPVALDVPDLCIGLWVQRDAPTFERRSTLARLDNFEQGVGVMTRDGLPELVVWSQPEGEDPVVTTLTGATRLDDGAWHHVVGCVHQDTFGGPLEGALWFDGAPVASGGIGAFVEDTSYGNLTMGGVAVDHDDLWDGRLDELSVWRAPGSTAVATAMYDQIVAGAHACE